MIKNTFRFLSIFAIVFLFSIPNVSAQKSGHHGASADAIKKGKQTHWTQPVKTGWQNTLLLNYELNVCPGLHWNTGYRINKLMYVGAGLGYNYDYLTWDDGNYYITTQWQSSSQDWLAGKRPAHRFPLYAQLAFYIMGERKVNPYIGVSQGVDVLYYSHNPKSDKMIAMGSHTRLDVGANFRLPKSGHSVLTTFELGISPIGEKYVPHIDHTFFMGFNIGFTF